MERNVPYLGYSNHIRLANDRVELLLSTDYGPRIIRYAALGGENVFAEILPSEQAKETPFGDAWHIYGGHRLWHAPEDPVRTYWPDNRPVEVSVRDGTVTLTQAIEGNTLLQKSIDVTLAASGSEVTLVHRIANRGAFEVGLSAWALTVMAPGGRAVFPNAPFIPFPDALLPARPLVLWSYTRLGDPRWIWGERFFQLRQDPGAASPQKIGFLNEAGWMAYLRARSLFVKRFAFVPGSYPDFGCNTETFTNGAMLELETLSPIVGVAPGAAIEHEERWSLIEDADPGEGEDELAALLDRALARARP
jgi:hypothetical protein